MLNKVKLDELGFVGRGRSRHRPRNDESLLGGKYPFIQTGEVKSANLYISDFSNTYNEKGLAQSKLWNEGTLLITIAANIAETAILNIKACFPDSIVAFIAYKGVSDVKYVKYYLEYIKRELQAISRGTTQDNMSLDKLLTRPMYVHDFKDQLKIASILSAYDDLIENNNQRIKLLEEMAEEIYKEWFVRLRFPGYENTKIMDGVPEGWKFEHLKKHIKYFRGKSYSSEELRECSEVAMLNLKNINRGGGFRRGGLKYFEGKYSKTNEAKFGDIIMAITDMTQDREIVGRCARVPKMNKEKFIISMDLIRIEPINLPKLYLYAFMRYSGIGLYLKEFANGVNVLHLTPELIKYQKALIPEFGMCNKFEKVITPMMDEIDVLANKNQILEQTRDLLLPRLISGKLSVEKLNLEESGVLMAAEPEVAYKKTT